MVHGIFKQIRIKRLALQSNASKGGGGALSIIKQFLINTNFRDAV